MNAEDNEIPASRAGADVVVNPLNFAGLLLATTHGGQHIADYLADLASSEGRVRLIERDVKPEEIGKSLNEIYRWTRPPDHSRRNAVRLLAPAGRKLEPGDIIMEICPTCE